MSDCKSWLAQAIVYYIQNLTLFVCNILEKREAVNIAHIPNMCLSQIISHIICFKL